MVQTYDVIIIGGGIIGASIAYHLARDGFDGRIGVFEKDPAYRHSTTCLSNAGIREQFSTEINIRISMYTLDVLKNFEAEMEVGGQPVKIGFKSRGYLVLTDENTLGVLRKNLVVQKRLGAQVEVLSPDQIQRMVPDAFLDNVAGGAFGRRDGYLDPYAFLQAYIKKGRSLGVDYLYQEVTEILRERGRVVGVKTNGGHVYSTETVVNAAGPWAAAVGEMVGLKLPISPLRNMAFCFNPARKIDYPLPLVFDGSGVYFRQETGGQILAARRKEDDVPGFNFNVDYDFFNEVIWPELAHRMPIFTALKLTRGWSAAYSVNTIDSNGIIGAHPELEGFYLATGFSGHGLQQAPAAGRGVSELIRLGRYETLDLSPLRFERFEKNELVIEESVFFSGEAHRYIRPDR